MIEMFKDEALMGELVKIAATAASNETLTSAVTEGIDLMVEHWKGTPQELCDALFDIITKATEKREHIHIGMPAKRIAMKRVVVGYTEAPASIRQIKSDLTTWDAANAYFSALDHSAKRDLEAAGHGGSYYKTDFTIVFDDGSEYSGRFDAGTVGGNLTDNVLRFLKTTQQEEAKKFLQNYDFNQ